MYGGEGSFIKKKSYSITEQLDRVEVFRDAAGSGANGRPGRAHSILA